MISQTFSDKHLSQRCCSSCSYNGGHVARVADVVTYKRGRQLTTFTTGDSTYHGRHRYTNTHLSHMDWSAHCLNEISSCSFCEAGPPVWNTPPIDFMQSDLPHRHFRESLKMFLSGLWDHSAVWTCLTALKKCLYLLKLETNLNIISDSYCRPNHNRKQRTGTHVWQDSILCVIQQCLKCLTCLYYDRFEAWSLNGSQIKSLQFRMNSAFRNTFCTNSYNAANECALLLSHSLGWHTQEESEIFN